MRTSNMILAGAGLGLLLLGMIGGGSSASNGVVVAGKPSVGGAIGCVNMDEGALATGKATGRIFALGDPDKCRSVDSGTVVVEQKYWRNAACVLPEGASPPCLWVMISELAYPKDYRLPNGLMRPRFFPRGSDPTGPAAGEGRL
jgi:hypothetical protein